MRLSLLAVPLCSLFLLACTDDGEAHQENAQLSSARDRFESSLTVSDSAYTFVIQRSCECTADVARAMRATVSDGEVISAIYVDTQADVPEALWPRSIEGVFDQIQAAYDDDAFEINITYDIEQGFPRSVYIDFDDAAADEELALQLSQVTPLLPG